MTAPLTWTVGPAGLDIPLPDPETARWSGDRLRLTGDMAADEHPRALMLRDQFAGLSDLEGQVVPATFSGLGERFDGYYRLAGVTLDAGKGDLAHGDFGWSVDLDLVRSSATARQQLRMSGAGRANVFFTTQRRGWWCPGVNAWGHHDGIFLINPATRAIREGSEGPMLVSIDNPADGSVSLLDATATWWVDPGDYHRGGVWVGRFDGPDVFRVVGRQFPAGARWALSNTLMAVLPGPSADRPEFICVWHDGDDWGGARALRITRYIDDTNQFPDAVVGGPVATQVVRNTPALSAIRVFYAALNTAGVMWLDVALRRGARHAEFRWSGPQESWGVRLATPESTTGHTSGTHATTGAHQVVLTSPQAVTVDSANGRIRSTSSVIEWRFMVGAAPEGAADDVDRFDDLVYQYMGTCDAPVQQVVLG